MLNRFARFSLAIAEIDRCWYKLAGSGMTNAERKVFYRCLEQITANLQTLSKEGLPQQ